MRLYCIIECYENLIGVADSIEAAEEIITIALKEQGWSQKGDFKIQIMKLNQFQSTWSKNEN